MSALTAHPPLEFGRAYARLDAGWKHLIATGPRWFMARVWKQCLDLVRASNAWPYESTALLHPRPGYVPDPADR